MGWGLSLTMDDGPSTMCFLDYGFNKKEIGGRRSVVGGQKKQRT